MLSLTAFFGSLLLGSMIFFIGIVLPSTHKTLNDEQALKYTRHIFPKFYLWGIVVSGIALGFSVAAGSTHYITLAIVLLGFAYSRQILLPKLLIAKDNWLSSENPEDKFRYKSLHKRSVLISIIQVVLLGIVVIITQIH